MLPIATSSYFRNLLDSFSAGVVIVNVRGLVYASNAAASALLGLSPEDLARPEQAAALLARTDAPRVVARFLAAPIKHGRKPDPVTVTYAHPDGSPRHFHLAGSLLLENDKIFGILIEIADVSEIFRLHARDKAMLLRVQAAQRERIASLGQFALAVAHQLRNPLMVIGGFAGRLLRGRTADDPEADFLSGILDSARRLEMVVRAVTAYARPREVRPVTVALPEAVGQAIAQARARTGSNVPARLEGTAPPVRADQALLVEAVSELVANALEATALGDRPEAAVTVRLVREGDTTRIEVADAGPGLAEEAAPFVFDPFFTTKTVGVGMGLPMARRAAEDLGGGLTIGPGPNGGCVAVLRLNTARPD